MRVELFYSKIRPGHLLALVSNPLDCEDGRVDLTPPEQFIQACVLRMKQGQLIKAHAHGPREPAEGAAITQEGWLVMRGRVRIKLFDLDRTILRELELASGELMINFHGGHSMESLEERTLVFEFKNGPYLGRDFSYF